MPLLLKKLGRKSLQTHRPKQIRKTVALDAVTHERFAIAAHVSGVNLKDWLTEAGNEKIERMREDERRKIEQQQSGILNSLRELIAAR